MKIQKESTSRFLPICTGVWSESDVIFNIQELDDLGAGFVRFLEMAPPKGWVEKLKLLPVLKEVADVFPKTIKNAPCQEVVNTENPDLEPPPGSYLLAL